MTYSTEFYQWILTSLFMIGLFLLPIGLGFCLIPDKLFKLAGRMNKWVATDNFFNEINKPRYKEQYFYRHHKVFGVLVALASIVSLYLLTFYIGIDSVTHVLAKLGESAFEKWLYIILYYILIVAIILAVVFGIIMYIRPSALKMFETWSNQWIDTDTALKSLDKQNNIPDRILPGNPRIFGLFVIFGAIYIMWNTFPF